MNYLRLKILAWAKHIMAKRPPDIIIGRGYLYRWYILPRNPLFNVYLHLFLGSDDDRAEHDHPWVSLSWLLDGHLYEYHTRPNQFCTFPVVSVSGIRTGDWRFRRATFRHRLELVSEDAITLFITGPKIREWGFHCPRGWVPWYEFVDTADSGQIGKGCGE